MNRIFASCLAAAVCVLCLPRAGLVYPPAVGILGTAKSCLACHVDNGPWKGEENTIIDIIEKSGQRSLRQPDGSFLIEARRGEATTVLTVIGRRGVQGETPPYRNAWLYVDPQTIGSTSLSKFAPGWDVNLPMACRIVGDSAAGYEGLRITALPMTVRPTDAARDGEVALQVMLTMGESVKGSPKEGMVGNYYERKVMLRVKE
jgi:hypothetical protein